MKTIVLGDIHANLPALEVCWEKAEAEGYDRIVHTGDVVGFGPFPQECVAFLRDRNIPGARGHFDDAVGADAEQSGAHEPSPGEQELAEASFAWTRRTLGAAAKIWLSSLPFEWREQRDGGLVVLHASPFDLHSALEPGMPETLFTEYGEEARGLVIVFGHRHRSFHRVVDRRHFVNAGSVGRPEDGDPRTGYAVVETGKEVSATFRRFPYDTEAVARAARARGAPSAAGHPGNARSMPSH